VRPTGTMTSDLRGQEASESSTHCLERARIASRKLGIDGIYDFDGLRSRRHLARTGLGKV
jgi:hypothetical protein